MANKKRRTFTPEFKADVVEQVRTGGKRAAQVARELGLSESSVRAWLRQADAEVDRSRDRRTPSLPCPPLVVGTLPLQKEEAPEAPAAPFVPRASLAPTPAFVETPARPSAFRMVQAQALLPRKPTHRPPAAVAQPPAAPPRFALLAGAAAFLLLVGFLFLSRPAEGGAEAVAAPAPAPSAAPSAVTPAETHPEPHYVARFPPAPVPAPSAAPAPEPAPAPAASTPPATVGTIVTTTQAHDHRIFVDGKTVGATGETIEVRCGHHRARYGSEGRVQEIDVPCGGQLTLEPSWGGAARAQETDEEIYPVGEPGP